MFRTFVGKFESIKYNNMPTNTVPYVPFKVKDMSLAAWGRKEIELAEAEMPGLMGNSLVLNEITKKKITEINKYIWAGCK